MCVILALETQKELDKITPEKAKEKLPVIKHIPTKGFYNILAASYLSGRGINGNPIGGLGGEYILGYQKNQWLSFGGGVGVNSYGEAGFTSIFADLRGYLRNSSASPYYSLGLGYGFNTRTNCEIAQATGGLYLNPSIGIRAASKKARHFLVSFGVKMQKSTITRNWEAWGMLDDKMFYTRFNIRYAFLF